MMTRLYVLVFVLLFAVACTPIFQSGEMGSVLSEETVIVYGRSGGFAGLQQEWTIHADGRIDLPDGSRKQVDAARVQSLFDTIQTANLQTLNESYLPENDCCDLFTYTLTVQTGSNTQTITTMDGASNMPEELTAVFQTIDQLIQTEK
jgi:hypothetical protein